MFKRKAYDRLLEWKNVSNGSTSIQVDGARRVGKSTIVTEFARNEYDKLWSSTLRTAIWICPGCSTMVSATTSTGHTENCPVIIPFSDSVVRRSGTVPPIPRNPFIRENLSNHHGKEPVRPNIDGRRLRGDIGIIVRRTSDGG